MIVSDTHVTYYVHLIVSQGTPLSTGQQAPDLVDDDAVQPATSTSTTRPRYTSFISILLAKGTATKDDDKLPRLMSALAWAGLQTPLVHQVDVVPETTIKCKRPDGKQSVRITSACDKNYWVKVYPSSSERRWEINLLKIPGAMLVVDTPLLKVMRYPNIEGEVCPDIMTPALFLKAAEQLLDLHTNTRCAHGDVRLDNLVVNMKENTVQWIDFDFASNIDHPMYYPLNWIIPLPDAQRHPAAVSGNLILPEHDVFSFRSLLELYRPMSEEVHDWFVRNESDDDQNLDFLSIIDRLKRFHVTSQDQPATCRGIFFCNSGSSGSSSVDNKSIGFPFFSEITGGYSSGDDTITGETSSTGFERWDDSDSTRVVDALKANSVLNSLNLRNKKIQDALP